MTTDNNGMVRIESRWNNPRATNEPHVSFNWGANSNTAPLFMSRRPAEHLHGLTRQQFKERVTNLDAAGFAGLDTDTAGHIQEKYIGKYA